MDTRAREVLSIGDKLFSSKTTVDSLWQELANNFYPERADFTDKRNEGDEYSDHLFSSYPVLARRELGNMISANVRPQSLRWGAIHIADEDLDERDEVRKFLEHLTDIMWLAMYDPRAGFVRATKQADHDYAAFGNAAIYIAPSFDLNNLYYRNYHLRDCVWSENSQGIVDLMFRNWQPAARQLKEAFGDKISSDVRKACKDEPERKIKCRHVVMPSRLYEYSDGKTARSYPFTSLLVERESETVLEEVPLTYFPYVVPRWQTVSGSVFGRSMATDIALPDARTTQIVTRTLREAGEKFVDPPMVAIADAIRSDVSLYAGGITIADMEYDERLGEVLRPVSQDRGGMPIGFEIAAALREDIRHAFFLDKIQLPEVNVRDMTAFEVNRRIQESIRASSPLFEPIEQDYSQPLCEVTFHVLKANGAFPMLNDRDTPEPLRGKNIKFKFRSPLSEMKEQSEAATFMHGLEILGAAVAVDEAQAAQVNITRSTRDALRAIGYKADWFNPEEAVEEERQRAMQMRQMQMQMQMAQQAGMAVEQGGKAGQAVNEAMGAG